MKYDTWSDVAKGPDDKRPVTWSQERNALWPISHCREERKPDTDEQCAHSQRPIIDKDRKKESSGSGEDKADTNSVVRSAGNTGKPF